MTTQAIATDRPEGDHIRCSGCPDSMPRREIRDHAGWPLCPDCHAEVTTQADHELTRQLAYAA